MSMLDMGFVHIYYGDGKGKTTAAIGQAIRAAGNNCEVLFYQFLKDNTSGERIILNELEHITCIEGRTEELFSFQMNQKQIQESKDYYQKKFAQIDKQVVHYQMLVLDEIICAIQVGLLEEEQVIRFLKQKNQELEVIMTGNVPSEKLKSCADYITEMKKEKHPFDKGEKARRGIEF